MNTSRNAPVLKFAVFAAVMLMLSGFLVVVFGDYRSGSTTRYSAVFADASKLEVGDDVRVAGVRVGTVGSVELLDDHRVRAGFDVDRDVVLSTETSAAVRYLNLVGDRYMELTNGPGALQTLPADTEIPIERTTPALDLDLLLGGLRPVIQGLNPRDVNALTWSLLEIVQGKEGTVESLLAKTASFTSALGDNSQVVEQLITNLQTVMATLAEHGADFSGLVDRLERLVTELSQERDPIGEAIEALDNGTASMAGLLTQARPPLAGTVDELSQVAPLLDGDKHRLDHALGRAPENFRKLVRTGSYGNFIQYYLCQVSVRVTDAATGEVVQMPWVGQETGRCTP